MAMRKSYCAQKNITLKYKTFWLTKSDKTIKKFDFYFFNEEKTVPLMWSIYLWK